jgi:flagellar biosynthesis/type III secretory pathway chaperone
MKLLERFVRIIEDEAGLYARMPAILQREKRVIADRTALSRVCAEKEKLIAQIRGLETARAEMLPALADILDCRREALTLARLSRRVDEPHASRIKSAGERLSSLIRRIQDANRSNRHLIEHHLQLVQGAISFIQRTRKPHQVYHRSGEVRQVRPTGRVFSGKI